MMRRTPLFTVVVLSAAAIACGFSGEGTFEGSPASDGGTDALAPRAPGSDGSASDAPADAPPSFTPSHVPPGVTFDDTAADVSGSLAIDTSTPAIKPPLPAGARLEKLGNVVVLFVGAWTVNGPVAIRGDLPLVVLAARAVTVSAGIDAGAQQIGRGPGGFASLDGPGKGGNGAQAGTIDTGGGGASFGGLGANGGSAGALAGGTAGVVYGDTFAEFFGGSGGGQGSPPCTGFGRGGAGGGALQISSRVAITVASAAWINAGGGGGEGGCKAISGQAQAGGGGGSGGTLVLEAPDLAIVGALAANGGGGGAGGSGVGALFDGAPGTNAGAGLPAIAPAAGGTTPADGLGGAGATNGSAAVTPPTVVNNQGGGGGGVGRIWLRTFGNAPVVTGAISPTPRSPP